MRPSALSVLIPSRHRAGQSQFLAAAIQSIVSATERALSEGQKTKIIVGLDKGSPEPSIDPSLRSIVKIAWTDQPSQAHALNECSKHIDTDLVAILEDDDQWSSDYLLVAAQALRDTSFVSSTQLEVSPSGDIIRIQDFPTPSGWIMTAETFFKVGPFDPSYRYHLDNDWLGRLNETQTPRTHLVDATAPMSLIHIIENRPSLLALAQNSGPNLRIARHTNPWPLVRRLVHPESGMARIRTNEKALSESDAETKRLNLRFGRTPW